LAPPAFDWRELQRWSIAESRLPAGSTVMFQPQSRWRQLVRTREARIAMGSVQGALIGAVALTYFRRRQRQKLLKDTERRFHMLAAATPTIAWLTGPDKRCVDISPQWAEYTGQSVAAARGFGWLDAVHPEDRGATIGRYQAAWDEEVPVQVQFRRRRHDGDYRQVLATGVPRYTSNRKFVGYVGACVDISSLQPVTSGFDRVARDGANTLNRREVAQALRDDLGQRLVGLTMQMYALTHGPLVGEELKTCLTDLSRQFGELTQDISTLSDRLHSPALDERFPQ
jgi:PAS domain S-box-containing protein